MMSGNDQVITGPMNGVWKRPSYNWITWPPRSGNDQSIYTWTNISATAATDTQLGRVDQSTQRVQDASLVHLAVLASDL